MDSSVLRPEEAVRKSFIQFLVGQGYPEAHIVFEKALCELPHLQTLTSLPYRRVDLLVYGMLAGELKPLLLVECKADKGDLKALQQLAGYNFYVQAPYIALASKMGYLLFNSVTLCRIAILPSYEQLCLQASHL